VGGLVPAAPSVSKEGDVRGGTEAGIGCSGATGMAEDMAIDQAAAVAAACSCC